MFVLSFSTGNWVFNRSMKCTQNGSIVVRTTLSDNSISATAEIWIGLRGLCGRVFALQNIYRDPKTKGLSLFFSPDLQPEKVFFQERNRFLRAFCCSFQPPYENLRHGKILGYYLGYKATNSSDPYRYQTLEVTKAHQSKVRKT